MKAAVQTALSAYLLPLLVCCTSCGNPGGDGAERRSLPKPTASATSTPLPAVFIEGATGFPCANFSVSGEVSPDGELFKRILYNPPVIGQWLDEWGFGNLAISSGGVCRTAADFHDRTVERTWPTASARWADRRVPVRVQVEAWAPVVRDDVASTALPVLVARLQVEQRPPSSWHPSPGCSG